MNKIQETLIGLINEEVFHKELNNIDINVDWNLVYREAVVHNIDCVIFDIVNKNIGHLTEYELLIAMWRKSALYRMISHKRLCNAIENIFVELTQNRIPYVMLKGFEYKTLYPNPDARYMGDVDIYIDKTNLDIAIKVIEKMGYLYDKNDTHTYHLTFLKEGSICIELHYGFFNQKSFNGNQYLEQNAWLNREKISINGVDIFVLSPDHSVIYSVLHAIKHISGKGIGIRQLLDLALYINAHRDFISFENVALVLKGYESESIFWYLITLINDLFGMNLLIAYKIDAHKFTLLSNYVFETGVFGQRSPSIVLETHIANELVRKQIHKASKLKLKLLLLFPNKAYLGNRYDYAKKNGLLLPVAWIHRIFYRIFYPNVASKEVMFSQADLEIVFNKVELMEFFKLESH